MTTASVLITTYNRPKLLMYGLGSLVDHELSNDIEIIVLNDGNPNDGTKEICELYSDFLNIRYFSTSRDYSVWRVPGFAINFGVKQSTADIIFISCAEIYHIKNTVNAMIDVLHKQPRALVIPSGKDDDGRFLQKLDSKEKITEQDYLSLEQLTNIRFPFFMGLNKNEFIKINGYDEDFVGIGFDDNDIVYRLEKSGCHYVSIPDYTIVHIFHPRNNTFDKPVYNRLKSNEYLFHHKKKDSIIRNRNREWGISF